MSRILFLRDSSIIKALFRTGKRVRVPEFDFIFTRSAGGHSLGNVITGRRYGNAVKRNRVKRRFREIILSAADVLHDGVFFLILPKPLSEKENYAELKGKIFSILQREGFIKKIKE